MNPPVDPLCLHLYSRYDQQSEAPLAFNGRDAYVQWLIRSFFPASKSASIVDLGCGWGKAVLCANRLGYLNIVGVESSASQIRQAKRLGVQSIIKADIIDFVEADNGSYDCLLLCDVLEHLSDDQLHRFLSSCQRILRKGGKIIIQTNNAWSPFFASIRYGDATHQRAFTPGSINQLFSAYGFSCLDIREIEPISLSPLIRVLRVIIWRLLSWPARLWVFAETGSWPRILSRNLIAIAYFH